MTRHKVIDIQSVLKELRVRRFAVIQLTLYSMLCNFIELSEDKKKVFVGFI